MGGMDEKSAAHTVAGMVTTSRNSTTTVHLLVGSAEAAVAAVVAETATTAAALSLAERRVPVLLQVWVLGLGDDWDRPGRSKANLVEAAKEEFVAEGIDCLRCIGCREVPF